MDRDRTEATRVLLEVRRTLQRFGCGKRGPAQSDHYVIDREMAERVAAELGRTLH